MQIDTNQIKYISHTNTNYIRIKIGQSKQNLRLYLLNNVKIDNIGGIIVKIQYMVEYLC